WLPICCRRRSPNELIRPASAGGGALLGDIEDLPGIGDLPELQAAQEAVHMRQGLREREAHLVRIERPGEYHRDEVRHRMRPLEACLANALAPILMVAFEVEA